MTTMIICWARESYVTGGAVYNPPSKDSFAGTCRPSSTSAQPHLFNETAPCSCFGRIPRYMGNCIKKLNVRVTADYGDDDDLKEPIVRNKRRFRYGSFDRDDHQANRILKKSSKLHGLSYQSTIKGKPESDGSDAKLFITTVRNRSTGTVELNGAAGSFRSTFSNVRYFNLSELRDATDGFSPSCMIGEGGFGRVYKGNVKEVETNGLTERTLPVAIKKLNPHGLQGQKEWLNFGAKISDFGLAKDGPMDNCSHVTTRILGTYGYADPQYMNTGRLKLTSDVYGFGVLLLELITSLPALDNTRPKLKRELVAWTKPFLAIEERRLRLMDRRLCGQYCNNTASMVTALASSCLHDDPHRRPDMSTVATTLSRVVDLLEMNSSSEGITLEASCPMPILGH
ncbi:hypothetical protein ACLOJK_002173 [Asimina triloba]